MFMEEQQHKVTYKVSEPTKGFTLILLANLMLLYLATHQKIYFIAYTCIFIHFVSYSWQKVCINVFSSPEPKAWDELIGWGSSRRPCVHKYRRGWLLKVFSCLPLWYLWVNAGVVCWYLLHTVLTRIRPDKMSGLIWVQTVWHMLIIFLKEFFEKVNFEKNQQMTKLMKNYPACKEVRYFSHKVKKHLCHIQSLQTIKEMISLHKCADWSASLLFSF